MRLLIFAAALALLPLAACSCEEEEPPPGDPYRCGGDGGVAMTCRVGEACVESYGTRMGFECAEDRGCPDNHMALYCPGARSAFCQSDRPGFPVELPDGGVVSVTKVLCNF